MPPSQIHEDDIEVPGMSRKTTINSISGLVAEYIVAIDVTRVRFPADAFTLFFDQPQAPPFSLSFVP